jgi:hypothetical protein
MDDDGTELSEAIKAVRTGLLAAQQDGSGSPIRFTVRDVTLDLGIELRRSGSVSGGVKAFVVSTDAKGEWAGSRTHRLTVTLEVNGADRVLIGDEEAGFGPTGAQPFA